MPVPQHVTVVQPHAVTSTTPKRKTVKKHHEAVMRAMSGKERQTLRSMCVKLLRDYKDVASKRGTRSFDMGLWLQKNIK